MTENSAKTEVFYDGKCPICVKEIRFLEKVDFRDAVAFVDIAAPDFEGAENKTHATLMDRMHVRTPDGEWLEGVDAFAHLYGRVGLKPVSWLLKTPGIRWLAEKSYDWFAANRLRLTGRCDNEACQHH